MFNSPDNVYSDDLTTPKRTKWRAHWAICGAAFVFLHVVEYVLYFSYFFFHQKQQLFVFSFLMDREIYHTLCIVYYNNYV